jgi:hypothetical protein
MATMFINSMTDLWNVGGNIYTAIKMNVTNTASHASSKLMDLLVASVSKFSVTPAGAVSAASTISATGAFLPVVDDGATVGSTTFKVSDLFGADGFTINFNNSNWVATHTSGILTVGTGDLRITNNFDANAASVVTRGGAQTLTNKTLTTPTINGATLSGAISGGTYTGTSLTSPTITGSPTATGATWASLGTVTTVAIAGGSIVNTTIAGSTGSFTTLNATGGGALTGTWTSLGTVTSVTINGGFINNTPIGSTTPSSGAFAALSAVGNVTLSPAGGAVVLSPTGAGTVTINPATASTINNTSIGVTTRAAGAFTTLAANSTVTLSAGATFTGTFTGGTFTSTTLTAPTINAATLTGTISGGTFTSTTLTSPTINGGTIAGGTFSGTSIFTGNISGTTGGFTSTVSMAGLTATTGTFSSAVSMTGLTATTGTFSGAMSATTGTFSGAISATGTSTFGTVSATGHYYTAGSFVTSAATFIGYVSNGASAPIQCTASLLTVPALTCSAGDINATGSINSNSKFYSDAGRFVCTGINSIFAGTGTTGALYLRPRGEDAGTSQAYILASTGEFRPISVSEVSDDTLKKDFRPLARNLVNDIATLEIGSFKWIDNDVDGYGVKAQAMRVIMPEVVTEGLEGLLGVNYGKAALSAVIDASKRILALEARLAELEGKV